MDPAQQWELKAWPGGAAQQAAPRLSSAKSSGDGSSGGLLRRRHFVVLFLLLSISAAITALPALVHRGGDLRTLGSRFLPPPCVNATPSAAAAGGAASSGPAAGGATAAAVPDEALPPPPRRLVLPWGEPLLTRQEARRGQSYHGSDEALQRLAAKLLAGKPIKAAALGGSVTGGGGSSEGHTKGFVALFYSFLRANFPHEQHQLENRAIGASTAFLFAACLQYHMLADADLVIVEFSVNEKAAAPYPSPERHSYEQLLRGLLRLPGRPAVIIVHQYGWWNAAGDGADRGLFYADPEPSLSAFSHYYDIPTVSVRDAAWRLMAADVDIFKVSPIRDSGKQHMFTLADGRREQRGIPAAEPGSPHPYYYDEIHPADPGHQAIAELLAEAVSRAVRDVSTPGNALTDADIRQHRDLPALPPPMAPGSMDEVQGLCAMQEAFKDVVRNSSGFEYAPERPSANAFKDQKWGWRSETPGSWVELEFDTQAADQSSEADTRVWLGHLASQGAGTARIECVAGCTCEPHLLEGAREHQGGLFTFGEEKAKFHVTRSAGCRIRVTVLAETGKVPPGGHKVMLASLLVTHVPLHGGTLGWAGGYEGV